jgi:hypothetical protein
MTLSTALGMRLNPRIYLYVTSFHIKYMTAVGIVYKGTLPYNITVLRRKQYLCGYDISLKIWIRCGKLKRKIMFHISITDGGSVSHLLVVGECGCVA